ncbi:ataxin-1a [Mastacembelus armatus]|uniref:Ataxin 1a n=1 Tax=Mastacembelus armatus TaxID=205130 RepID=A0A3Q3MIL3_9TELE|nr:ataxin-1 [Mastacembelus armatus]XP_026155616.1 ataxin-1 [Mastacembelus armatus]XP_026155617.1 ataxin-1 [Mastacembelus armatus]XP_026155619.1 ataxin-1 [Mastacembelus armatus]XP_026155620.1 ataxin-1 [Mastacembelus armatus]XP_026155621.1 ataxin-1 [Mastacembelus armatus]
MKSNQERSNECLPPKKREIPSSTLPSENRSPTIPPASDSQRTENMAWLASVAGGNESSGGGHRSSIHSDGPQYKSLSSTSDLSSSPSSLRLVSSLPAVHTSPLSQSTVGGTVHYTQLPPNLQLIAPHYRAPYTGYISPQLLPPPPPPPPLSSSSSSSLVAHRSSHTEAASAPSPASKHDQLRASSGRTSMPPPPTDTAHHHIQMSTSPRTVSSSHHQGGVHLPPQSLHPHHTLGHGMSQVVVQDTDGPARKEEGGSRPRELHNGELERGRRFGVSPESSLSKSGSKSREHLSSLSSYDGRQLVLPSEYSTHDHSGLRTSVMLMPNSHMDHQLVAHRASPEKLITSAPTHLDKGGIILGKPVNRIPSSSNTTSSFTFPPPLSVDSMKAAVSTLSPQTVIQTTHNVTESLSMGLPSTSIYPQPPIIGYIAGGSGSQHTPINYHTSLQPHLLIPGTQPVIIPVSGGGVTTLEPVTSHVTSSTQATPFPTTLPHTYIAATAPKGEVPETPSGTYHQATSGAVVQAQLHLPLVPMPPGLVAPSAPPPPSSAVVPPSLPPYFIKGSIIQLADGELKRVEDLKTEDFIQSAEISSELKIDSSTVERIEGSHTSPNFAVVQFSVGEHRAQVSVEVLVEYPFFVFGQGWSSCCPDRTTQLLELPCTKLSVGDVCISLTLKNLKNGSLKKTQPLELATPASIPASIHGHLKPPRGVSDSPQSCSAGGSRHSERENGIGQRGSGGSGNGSGGAFNVENGDLMVGDRGSVCKGQVASSTEASSSKPSGGRKRRWSAPESRKVEKSEEEPPLTLPKPSFIPHEVKVSIEGRSNIGK